MSFLPSLLKFYCCRREALYHVTNYLNPRQDCHGTLSQKTIPKYFLCVSIYPCIYQIYAQFTKQNDSTVCQCSIIHLFCFKINVYWLKILFFIKNVGIVRLNFDNLLLRDLIRNYMITNDTKTIFRV